jgi:hypothetical protein
MKPVVKKLTKVSHRCPTEWIGITEDDRPIQIRYKWCVLRVCIGEKGETIYDARKQGKSIYDKKVGKGSYMKEPMMLELLEDVLDFSEDYKL